MNSIESFPCIGVKVNLYHFYNVLTIRIEEIIRAIFNDFQRKVRKFSASIIAVKLVRGHGVYTQINLILETPAYFFHVTYLLALSFVSYLHRTHILLLSMNFVVNYLVSRY